VIPMKMRYTDWLMLLSPTTPPSLTVSEVLHPARIKRVEPDSLAARAGVQAGDSLLRVNGNAITDILAYRRELESGAKAGGATLEVQQTNGLANLHFTVEWEDPGLEFEEVLFDGIKICANKCEFCYVHQMPQGFRKSLYVMVRS
jgi:NifB/MoaA-like Fe-S oxidoreductase